MIKRKFLLLAIVLLLIPVGVVAAYSSANYTTQRYVIMGGGLADSANFSVASVIGQPATDVAVSANYKVSSGFLFPIGRNTGFRVWLPIVLK
jgi:hypothetical protein